MILFFKDIGGISARFFTSDTGRLYQADMDKMYTTVAVVRGVSSIVLNVIEGRQTTVVEFDIPSHR